MCPPAGPTPDTISDFWQMIWDVRPAVIVMLTKVPWSCVCYICIIKCHCQVVSCSTYHCMLCCRVVCMSHGLCVNCLE